mmetsp:Transcript_23990/g.51009  ORF Transcript_23990/g.51009 Transcript_23990/m.51009 type:complete len:129 (+) Transcript_23990:1106-1492(+)
MNSIDPDSARNFSPARSLIVATCDSSPSIFDDTEKSIGLSLCSTTEGVFSVFSSCPVVFDDGSDDSNARGSLFREESRCLRLENGTTGGFVEMQGQRRELNALEALIPLDLKNMLQLLSLISVTLVCV